MFSLLDKRNRKFSEFTGSLKLGLSIKKKSYFFKIRARHNLSQNLCRAVPCRADGTQFEVCRAVPVPANFSESFPSLD